MVSIEQPGLSRDGPPGRKARGTPGPVAQRSYGAWLIAFHRVRLAVARRVALHAVDPPVAGRVVADGVDPPVAGCVVADGVNLCWL